MPSRARPSIGAVSVLLLASLAACSSDPTGDRDPQHSERNRTVLFAAPTTLQDSGLLDALVPVFEQQTGYLVKTLAVGTGEGLAMAARGDVDVVIGHAPDLEQDMLAKGVVRSRSEVLSNDFLLIGPVADPAGVADGGDVAAALGQIARRGASFVSRGDESGTHHFERRLWQIAGMRPAGSWYTETGQGMGATLQVANQLDAYTLVDRGTYLSFRGRLGLRPVVVGDPRQLNIYAVLEVNPERFDRINADGARAFRDFLLDPATQRAIAAFGHERAGEALYRPAHESVPTPTEVASPLDSSQ